MIASKLSQLLSLPGVLLQEADDVKSALQRLEDLNVGFADSFLAAKSQRQGKIVVSFDHDFAKFKDVETILPS